MQPNTLISIAIILSFGLPMHSQQQDSIYTLTGLVSDQDFNPVRAAHIVNLQNRHIDISDSSGVFHISIMQGDSLWIKNIAFRDTIVVINNPHLFYIIQMKKKTYPIKEVKIFEWGSTYEDFKQAFLALKPEKSLQEKLGLPIADPDAIPYDLDEEYIKSLGFAITSPVSYLYQNLSKYEKSKRRVYRLEITKEKREIFQRIVSRQNISELTGLENPELEDFWIYLHENLICDFNCDEIKILEEIMKHFNSWKGSNR